MGIQDPSSKLVPNYGRWGVVGRGGHLCTPKNADEAMIVMSVVRLCHIRNVSRVPMGRRLIAAVITIPSHLIQISTSTHFTKAHLDQLSDKSTPPAVFYTFQAKILSDASTA